MTYKSGAGSMVYNSQNNRLQSLSQDNGKVKRYQYDANGNMTTAGDKSLTWTPFNKADTVKNKHAESQFDYDANHNRIKQHSITKAHQGKKGVVHSTLYVGKTFEKVTTHEGLGKNTVQYKHHIYAGDKVIAIHVRTVENAERTPDQLRYLHSDALGSIDTITDSHAKVIQQASYDPFGDRSIKGGARAWTKRDYTGHEHMEGLGLINMNVRLYDPEIARFLSPDTYIQAAITLPI